MTITAKDKIFLMLIRRALFDSNEQLSSIRIKNEDIDWKSVSDEALVHAMSLIAIDGTVGLEKISIPTAVLDEWQGRSIQFIIKNEALMSVQSELVEILEEENIHGAVIKGASAAFCYKNPESRILGDIDFLVREEDYDKTIEILEKKGFVKEENESNPCHTEMHYEGCLIEIHRYINGLPEGELGDYIKQIFEVSLEKDRCFETIGEYTFPVTNDLCQALTLLIHTQGHIRKGGLGLRHLCDWAAFVDKKLTDGLKAELIPILERVGLLKFFNILTETCEKFLFSDRFCLHEKIQDSSDLCDMLMLDFIFCGNFGRKEPETLRGSAIFTRTTVVNTKSGSFSKVRVFSNFIWFIRCSWPVCQKKKILLPVGFVYVPIRYLWRVITGKRKFVSAKFISQTAKRKSLYEHLELFEHTDKDKI